jgi:hypothetical protein
MKNSNDNIRNQTRDLPACNAVLPLAAIEIGDNFSPSLVKRPDTSHTVGFPTADHGRAQTETCYKTDTAMFNTTVQRTVMAVTDCQFKLVQGAQYA